jgi:hypothetical protein
LQGKPNEAPLADDYKTLQEQIKASK